MKIFDQIKKLYPLLDRQSKLQLIVLLLGIIVFSLFETAGIGVLVTYIRALAEPELFRSSQAFEYLDGIGLFSKYSWILILSFAVVVFFILRTLYTVSFTYLQTRYSRDLYDKLSERLFTTYLMQPYEQFTESNSADYKQALIQEANNVVALIPQLAIASSEALVVAILLGFLFLSDLGITISLLGIVGVTIFLLSKTLSRSINRLGNKKTKLLNSVYRALEECFGNMRTIRIRGAEDYGKEQFLKSSRPYNEIQVSYTTAIAIPRYLLELMGVLVVVFVVLYHFNNQTITQILPSLMLFAISLIRILPSLNRIMAAYNMVAYQSGSLDIIESHLAWETVRPGNSNIEFKTCIQLDNVSYHYSISKPVLEQVSLKIHHGEKVGIVGPSGGGKSTLVDLISGLIFPRSGKIWIDDKELEISKLRAWRTQIGFIPQTIYLFDGTVAENIFFGCERNDDKIKECLKKAQIWDFLQSKESLETRVGEGGILLSGGQKQRIAIARALYKEPSVLIFDEGTSALDPETENEIVKSIYSVGVDKTVIMIAHRLNTLQGCDRIIEVQDKKLKERDPESTAQLVSTSV